MTIAPYVVRRGFVAVVQGCDSVRGRITNAAFIGAVPAIIHSMQAGVQDGRKCGERSDRGLDSVHRGAELAEQEYRSRENARGPSPPSDGFPRGEVGNAIRRHHQATLRGYWIVALAFGLGWLKVLRGRGIETWGSGRRSRPVMVRARAPRQR